MDIFIILIITYVFIVLCSIMIVLRYLSNKFFIVDRFYNLPLTASTCSSIPLSSTPLSCLTFLKTCHKDYYDNVILKNRSKIDRDYLDLAAMGGKVDISNIKDEETIKLISVLGNMHRFQNDRSAYDVCVLPTKHLQSYEIDEDCLKDKGGYWLGGNVGCGIPIPDKVPSQQVRNSYNPRFAQEETPTFINDNFMQFVNELDERNKSGLKPPKYVLPFVNNVQLPDTNEFPELLNPIMKYREYYYQQKQVFETLQVRCGYINGIAYSYNKPNGENAIIPIVQKRFKDRYYTLIYRYATDAFRKSSEISEGLSEWFEKDTNWDKPKPKFDVLVDPKNNYDNLDKFLNHKNETYRDRFLFDNIKNSPTRYSIIIEVFNSYNKKPIFSLDLARYGSDEKDISKFFSSGRVRDSEFTSNKNIIVNQFNLSLFSIKNNGAKDVAWTIATNSPSCSADFPVYMCIPTADVCMPNTPMCNWQKWFSGNIIVTNDYPINLNGQISDFDNFKKKHIGEWMNIWAYAEYNDNFQNIEMNTGKYVMNPYAFRAVFNRPNNISDDKWALLIWKLISGDETTAEYSQTYKDLIKKVKDKQQLEFDDYVFACKNALANGQQKPFALSMACI